MLLSIHTCGTAGSVALGRANPEKREVRILAQAALPSRGYAAHLIPAIGEMLAAERITLREIEAIVVVRGPGSFTGIRVGLSAAKGLAQPTGIPLISLSRLELIAGVSGLAHVIAAIDAGRGDYYVGEYRDGREVIESLLTQAETLAALRQPGAGVLAYEQTYEQAQEQAAPDKTSALAACHPMYVQAPDAADALRIALSRFRTRRFDDAETLDGNYLRRPDAELPHAHPRGALSAT